MNFPGDINAFILDNDNTYNIKKQTFNDRYYFHKTEKIYIFIPAQLDSFLMKFFAFKFK